VSQEIDLIVVDDQRRAREIIDALKRAGIDHADCWSNIRGGRYAATVFHISVPEDDAAQAAKVLATSGLVADGSASKAAAQHRMLHFRARHENGCVELSWEARYGDILRWRVLRSQQGFAPCAEAPGSNEQVIVSDSTATAVVDRGLDPGSHFYYTVFSQEGDGVWCKQADVRLRPGGLLSWLHPHRYDAADDGASLAAPAPVSPSAEAHNDRRRPLAGQPPVRTYDEEHGATERELAGEQLSVDAAAPEAPEAPSAPRAPVGPKGL
jgi:hypothetical protein